MILIKPYPAPCEKYQRQTAQARTNYPIALMNALHHNPIKNFKFELLYLIIKK